MSFPWRRRLISGNAPGAKWQMHPIHQEAASNKTADRLKVPYRTREITRRAVVLYILKRGGGRIYMRRLGLVGATA